MRERYRDGESQSIICPGVPRQEDLELLDREMFPHLASSERRLSAIYGAFPNAETVAEDLSGVLAKHIPPEEIITAQKKRKQLVLLYRRSWLNMRAYFL